MLMNMPSDFIRQLKNSRMKPKISQHNFNFYKYDICMHLIFHQKKILPYLQGSKEYLITSDTVSRLDSNHFETFSPGLIVSVEQMQENTMGIKKMRSTFILFLYNFTKIVQDSKFK